MCWYLVLRHPDIIITIIIIASIIIIVNHQHHTCKLLISCALFCRQSDCSWEPPSHISGDTFTLVLVGNDLPFVALLIIFLPDEGQQEVVERGSMH